MRQLRFVSQSYHGHTIRAVKTDDGFVYVVTKRNEHGTDRIFWSGRTFRNSRETLEHAKAVIDLPYAH